MLYLLMTNLNHDLLPIVCVATQGQDMPLSEFVVSDFCELFFDQDRSFPYLSTSVREVKCPRIHGERWLMGEMIVG